MTQKLGLSVCRGCGQIARRETDYTCIRDEDKISLYDVTGWIIDLKLTATSTSVRVGDTVSVFGCVVHPNSDHPINLYNLAPSVVFKKPQSLFKKFSGISKVVE